MPLGLEVSSDAEMVSPALLLLAMLMVVSAYDISILDTSDVQRLLKREFFF